MTLSKKARENLFLQVIRNKDEQQIKQLLEAMCITAERDLHVFKHSMKTYSEATNKNADWLVERIEELDNYLMQLTFLKVHIKLLIDSPL